MNPRIKIIIFLYFLFQNLIANGQIGLPFIYNYTKKFNFYKTIWQIQQSPEGIIYFAGEEGIYEYDGKKLEKILQKSTSFFSLDFDKYGNLYFGSAEGIGELYIDSNRWQHKYFYYNLPINTVWATYWSEYGIYFLINKKTVLLLKNNKLYTVKNSNTTIRLFKVDHKIYMLNNKTISELIANKIFTINKNFDIEQQDIRVILPFEKNKYLIGTKIGNFYITDTRFNILQVIELENQEYIKKSIVYKGKKINDTTFLIGTLKSGIIAFNKNGKTLFVINNSLGLASNTIYDIFIDKEKNIWLAMPNGISKITLYNNATLLGHYNNIHGMIEEANIINDKLFIGTTEGLFYTNLKETDFIKRNKFQLISNDFLYITNIYKFNNKYLIGCYRYILLLDSKFKVIDRIKRKVALIYHLTKNKFLVSDNYGIEIIEIHKNKLLITKQFGSIKSQLTQILKQNDSTYWINSYSGLFLMLTAKKDQYKFYFFNVNNYQNEKIFLSIDSSLFININDKFFQLQYNSTSPQTSSFIEMNSLPYDIDIHKIITDNEEVIRSIKQHGNYIYFLTSKKLVYFNTKTKKYNFFNFEKLYHSFIPFNRNPLLFYKNKLLLISKRYIILIDTLLKETTTGQDSPPLILKSISINNKNLLFYKPIIDEYQSNLVFKASENVRLVFLFPSFISEENILFSYKIDNSEWSQWRQENFYVLSKSEGGHHTLYIKIKNLITSEEYTYSLQYKRKYLWYSSPSSIILYVISALILSYIYYKNRTIRIKKMNKILEEQIAKRTEILKKQNDELQKLTYELQKQKETIKIERDKLRLLTLELEQLSLVAKYTDNSVVIINPDGKIEWWNRGFTKLFKSKIDQMNNLSFKERIKKLRPKLIKIVKEYKGKDPVIYTNKEIINSKEIWYKTILNPVFDKEGNIINFVAIDIDITDIKSAEQAIEKQKRLLEEQAEELKQANLILTQQNEQIEQKNYEITSSIQYAKKIQEAILPHKILFKALFEEYFLIYKPKSIVSGDFYWFDYKNDKAIIVVGDSTGHGVPGAFMSILGITLLKDIIANRNELNPAEILFELRDRLVASLHQSQQRYQTRDGIDISILIADFKNDKLYFAGANSSIIIIKNNELNIIKGDKMPIGVHDRMNDMFSLHTLKFTHNEKVYMYSDGFMDQLGGPKDKKYSFKRFRELIFNISKYNFQKQKKLIEDEYKRWKINKEQTDDIIILGFKF